MTAAGRRPSWHLVTGEYPPQPGGVSDYSQQLSQALSDAGETVHVWAPRTGSPVDQKAVTLHSVPDFGPRGLRSLTAGLAAVSGPKRLLVQYVAPAFGYRGLNVPFVLWLSSREEEVWVQFHEVAYAFAWAQPPLRNVLAAVEWWMAQLVAEHARRVFISIPGWRRQLGRHADRAEVLPIPSNLPVNVNPDDAKRVRKLFGQGPLVGHFGTYGSYVAGLLAPAIASILRSAQETRFVLLGRGGPEFAEGFASEHPDVASRVVAPGVLDAAPVAQHIAACDVLIQPYPDGISGRRTSAMAALALGKPVITTTGHLTEAEWARSGAVVLAPVGDVAALRDAVRTLLASEQKRVELGLRARAWYDTFFSIQRTLAILRSSERVEEHQPILPEPIRLSGDWNHS